MNNSSQPLPRVLILAGGKGTRLASVVSDRPKPLALVAGKPFLFWLIKYLQKEGFVNFTLLAGHSAEKIKEFGTDHGLESARIDIISEDQPLGTGGAIKNAVKKFPLENDFLVLNGDTFFSLDYRYFLKKSKGHQLSVALACTEDRSRYGTVRLNSDSSITQFTEKQTAIVDVQRDGYFNAGVYLLSKDIFKNTPDGNFSFETDLLQKPNFASLQGVPCTGHFIDIGIPEDYARAQTLVPLWSAEKRTPALFLDRDGILIHHVPYIKDVKDVRYQDELIPLIQMMNRLKYPVVVVTNQAGIARNYFDEPDAQKINDSIQQHFANAGAFINDWQTCPFHPEGTNPKFKFNSVLRKPECGMFLKASERHPIDLEKSLMIGDNSTDQIRHLDLTTYLFKTDFEFKKLDPKSVVFEDLQKLIQAAQKYF